MSTFKEILQQCLLVKVNLQQCLLFNCVEKKLHWNRGVGLISYGFLHQGVATLLFGLTYYFRFVAGGSFARILREPSVTKIRRTICSRYLKEPALFTAPALCGLSKALPDRQSAYFLILTFTVLVTYFVALQFLVALIRTLYLSL